MQDRPCPSPPEAKLMRQDTTYYLMVQNVRQRA